MSAMVVKIDELADRLEQLAPLVDAGDEVLVEHTNGHRVKLVLTPINPNIPKSRRWVLGLHAGMMTMSDDFKDPLPDEYWEGALD